MARKKAPKNNRPKKEKPAGRSGGGGFLNFLISRPVRNVILIVVVIVLLTVFWDDGFFRNLRLHLGWGVLFIAAAVITLIMLAWRGQLGSLVRHWNRWLGGIAFVFAIWGIMGLDRKTHV